MRPPSWIRSLFSTKTRPFTRSRQRTRLSVEQLEDRNTPSAPGGSVTHVLVWDGGGADNLASNAVNWVDDVVPIDGDIAIFNGTSNKDAVIDVAFADFLSEMQVNAGYSGQTPGYTGQITFEKDLSITNLLTQADGTLNLDAGSLNIDVGATFSFSGGTIVGSSALNIDGTMTSSGGSTENPLQIEGIFNSTGNVNVTAGALLLKGGGSFSATIDTAANTEFLLGGGDFTAFQGAEGTGQGRFVVGSGGNATTYQIDPNATARHFNLNLSQGGTINGGGNLQVLGEWNFAGGEVSGLGSVVNGGTMNVAGNTIRLAASTFQNLGTVNWTANFQGAAAQIRWDFWITDVTNTGTWNFVTVQGRTLDFVWTQLRILNPTFQNNGQIVQTGDGQTLIREFSRFRNGATGSIVAQGGQMRFSAIPDFVTARGSYMEAQAGTSITFEAGSYTFTAFLENEARQMRGAGTFVAGDSATIVIPVFHLLEADRFQMTGQGATLSGGGEFIPHYMLWGNGSLTGGGRITIGANDRLILDGSSSEGGGNLTLGGRVNNGGTIEWQPGASTITLTAGGAFNNDGGTFDVYNPSGVMEIAPLQTGSFFVRNNGALRKFYTEDNSETATTYFNVPVTNDDGRILAEGRMRFKSYTQTSEHAKADFGSTVYTFDEFFVAADGAITLDGGYINNSGNGAPTAYYTDITNCTVELNGAIRGTLRFRTAYVSLTGDLEVLGATGQADWTRWISSTVNLQGHTLINLGGGINMDSPAGARGTMNYQGGRVRARFSSYENVDITGRGGNPGNPGGPAGQMNLGPGGTLQVSELGTFGTFSIDDNLDVDATAQMTFQIGNNLNDQLTVGGHLNLAGLLNVTVQGNVSVDDEFIIVTFDTLDGTFANENNTVDLGNGLYAEILYLEHNITLRICSYGGVE